MSLLCSGDFWITGQCEFDNLYSLHQQVIQTQYNTGGMRLRTLLTEWRYVITGAHKYTLFIAYMTQPLESTCICHFMMTSSNENIFPVTGHLCGEFTGQRWIPAQRPVTRNFHVFFDLRLNKRLSKQSWGFETLSRPLWRHCNVSSPVKTDGYLAGPSRPQIAMNCACYPDGTRLYNITIKQWWARTWKEFCNNLWQIQAVNRQNYGRTSLATRVK